MTGVGQAVIPLAPPITLGHVTAPLFRLRGEGEYIRQRPETVANDFSGLICPSVL